MSVFLFGQLGVFVLCETFHLFDRSSLILSFPKSLISVVP
jgi:hypothetical protein